MKISLSNQNYKRELLNKNKQKNNNGTNFKASRLIKNASGVESIKFFQNFDEKSYDCFLQLFEVTKKGQSFVAKNITQPTHCLKMGEGKKDFIFSKSLINSIFDGNVGYNWVLKPKGERANHSTQNIYIQDNGMLTEDKSMVVLSVDNMPLSQENPANCMLVMPDMCTGYKTNENNETVKDTTERDKNAIKTHVTSSGGNLAGITARLKDWSEQGYTKFMTCPITSSNIDHNYWTINPFQSKFPQEEVHNMYKEAARTGMTPILDVALTSESLMGVYQSGVQKWGENDPFYNWFSNIDLDKNVITYGILSPSENANFKLINSPYTISQDSNNKIIMTKNKNYNPAQPTLVQFFDKRLVTDEQATSNELIKEYAKKNPENSFEITKNHDGQKLYSFEINTNTLKSNIEERNKQISNISEKFKGDHHKLQSVDTIKNLFNFAHFAISTVSSGYNPWDGNADIAKYNLHVPSFDINSQPQEKIKEKIIGRAQVIHNIMRFGKFQAESVNDSQMEYITHLYANTPKTLEDYKKRTDELIEKGMLPKETKEKLNDEILKNIIEGNYSFDDYKNLNIGYNRDYVLYETMKSVPLESIGFSKGLTTILAYPYITQRPFNENDIDKTATEISNNDYKDIDPEYRALYKEMDEIYQETILPYTIEIMETLNKNCNEELFDKTGKEPKLTAKGAYFAKLFTKEITRALFASALTSKDVLTLNNNGQIQYNTEMLEKVSPQSLEIQGWRPKDEARQLISILNKKIKQATKNSDLKTLLEASFSKRINGIDETNINLSRVIIEKNETGLGLRIDATKDFSNIDYIRNDDISFDEAWDNVIFVTKKLNQSVRNINPNAYITAELTDLNEIVGKQDGSYRYKTERDAERALYTEAGINSLVNYKYAFGALNDIINETEESGDNFTGEIKNVFKEKFENGWTGSENMLFAGPSDSSLRAYNFYENQDKPRLLHINTLNVALFHSNFTDNSHRDIASWVLGKSSNEIDFNVISPKAIAMGEKIKTAFHNYYGFNQADMKDERTETTTQKESETGIKIEEIDTAIAELAQGQFKGKQFNPEIFGVRPFDITTRNLLEQVEYNRNKNGNSEKFSQETLDKFSRDITKIMITTPHNDKLGNYSSLDRQKMMYKIMVTIPGMATEFYGGRYGSTGYETYKNNVWQQNRNVPHEEWADSASPEKIEELVEHNKFLVETMKLREKISALGDGETIPLMKDENPENSHYYATFRYNDKGSRAITLYAPKGYNQNYLLLGNIDGTKGLKSGVEIGTIFRNANEKDNSIYRVERDGYGTYVIKKYASSDTTFTNPQNITLDSDEYGTLILYNNKNQKIAEEKQ